LIFSFVKTVGISLLQLETPFFLQTSIGYTGSNQFYQRIDFEENPHD